MQSRSQPHISKSALGTRRGRKRIIRYTARDSIWMRKHFTWLQNILRTTPVLFCGIQPKNRFESSFVPFKTGKKTCNIFRDDSVIAFIIFAMNKMKLLTDSKLCLCLGRGILFITSFGWICWYSEIGERNSSLFTVETSVRFLFKRFLTVRMSTERFYLKRSCNE